MARRTGFWGFLGSALALGTAFGACGGAEQTIDPVGGNPDATTSGDPGDEFGPTCAKENVTGELLPMTMFIMFDKSGSMLFDQKWTGVKTALTAFFQNPESAGLRIALRFFPDDDPVAGCDELACDTEACATQLVTVGELTPYPSQQDPQQALLVTAIGSREPSGETPMYPALAGATQAAIAHVADLDPSSDKRVVVVLVTDGEPKGCNEDPDAIASLAGDAFDAGVPTYVVGMEGANLSQLDEIAAQGGTGQAFVVGNENVHNTLLKSLTAIRTASVPCELAVPETTYTSQTVDYQKAIVSYLPESGDADVFPNVEGADACKSAGWYYDNPKAPTKITLCPESCELVQDDPFAELEIVLGCTSVAN